MTKHIHASNYVIQRKQMKAKMHLQEVRNRKATRSFEKLQNRARSMYEKVSHYQNRNENFLKNVDKSIFTNKPSLHSFDFNKQVRQLKNYVQSPFSSKGGTKRALSNTKKAIEKGIGQNPKYDNEATRAAAKNAIHDFKDVNVFYDIMNKVNDKLDASGAKGLYGSSKTFGAIIAHFGNGDVEEISQEVFEEIIGDAPIKL